MEIRKPLLNIIYIHISSSDGAGVSNRYSRINIFIFPLFSVEKVEISGQSSEPGLYLILILVLSATH